MDQPDMFPTEEAADNQRPGCWIPLVLLLILAMLGSSIYSVIWLAFLRDREPEIVVIDVTATPAVSGEAADEGPTPGTDEDVAEIPAPFVSAQIAVTPVPMPAVPRDQQTDRIVFIDSDSAIVSVSPHGGDLRLHNSGNGQYTFPAWSPDGEQIAAVGVSPAGPGIFVLPAEGEEERPQALYSSRTEAPFYLYWSPDSRQVSFLANHQDGMALHVVPADATTGNRELTVGGPLYWQWSANGRAMLMHSGFSGDDAFLEYFAVDDAPTGETFAPPGFFQSPGISADGRFWAYATQTGRLQSELVVLNRQTDENLQYVHEGQIAMSWSPVGNLLAFISPEERGRTNYYGPLRVLDPASGDIQVFTQERVVAFFWSPDGRFLASLSVDAPQNDPDIITNDFAKDEQGKPAGQSRSLELKLTLYDVVTGEGRVLFFFRPTNVFVSQFLPYFDQYALSHRLWSPQSDALVLPVREGNESQLYVIPISGGQPRYLAEGSMPSWSQR